MKTNDNTQSDTSTTATRGYTITETYKSKLAVAREGDKYYFGIESTLVLTGQNRSHSYTHEGYSVSSLRHKVWMYILDTPTQSHKVLLGDYEHTGAAGQTMGEIEEIIASHIEVVKANIPVYVRTIDDIKENALPQIKKTTDMRARQKFMNAQM